MHAVAHIAPTRAQLVELEHAIRDNLPAVPYETLHTHAPGLYIRSMRMPAGSVATGRVHTTEHIFILTRGEMTIATEEGVRRIGAGYQCISKPGTKRAVFCHTDVECSNVHITTETDLVKLEAALVEPAELLEHTKENA